MTAGSPGPVSALQRSQRKEDLLLASQLARGQVVGAFDELAGRADALALRVLRVRAWLSNPLVWMAGSALGVLLLPVVLRRPRAPRMLRWGARLLRWWRLWRLAVPALAAARYSFDKARGSGRGLPSRSIAT